MTRTTTARIAGFTFLLYFAASIASMLLARRAHATDVLSLFTSLSAVVLGVPMLVFEVALALWLLVKGVAAPAPRQAP